MSVSLVDSYITLALLHADLVAILHMVANPTGDILGRRIDRSKDFVDILMVEGVLHNLLDMREVGHHTILVEFARTAIDRDHPIVSVQILALGFVAERQVMCRRYS